MERVRKIVNIILWVLLIVSAVFVVALMFNISDNEADSVMGGWINTNLVWAYMLIAIGAGIAILAGIYQMITDRQAAKDGLIALVFLGVVVLVSYLLASDEIPQYLGAQRHINEGTLTPQIAKNIEAGLFVTYILLGLAVLAIVLAPVTRLFK